MLIILDAHKKMMGPALYEDPFIGSLRWFIENQINCNGIRLREGNSGHRLRVKENWKTFW